jgi:hypothetical protein
MAKIWATLDRIAHNLDALRAANEVGRVGDEQHAERRTELTRIGHSGRQPQTAAEVDGAAGGADPEAAGLQDGRRGDADALGAQTEQPEASMDRGVAAAVGGRVQFAQVSDGSPRRAKETVAGLSPRTDESRSKIAGRRATRANGEGRGTVLGRRLFEEPGDLHAEEPAWLVEAALVVAGDGWQSAPDKPEPDAPEAEAAAAVGIRQPAQSAAARVFGDRDLRAHILRERRIAIGRDANLAYEERWRRRREAAGAASTSFPFELSRGVSTAAPPFFRFPAGALAASSEGVHQANAADETRGGGVTGTELTPATAEAAGQAARAAEMSQMAQATARAAARQAAAEEIAAVAARDAEASQMVQAAARAAARRAAVRVQCCWRRCVALRRREVLVDQRWWRQTGTALQRGIAARGVYRAVVARTGAVGWEEVSRRSQLERRGRLSRAAEARSLARWWLAEQRAVSVVDAALAAEVTREAACRRSAAERLQRIWRCHQRRERLRAAVAAREAREEQGRRRRRRKRADAKAEAVQEVARAAEMEQMAQSGARAAARRAAIRIQGFWRRCMAQRWRAVLAESRGIAPASEGDLLSQIRALERAWCAAEASAAEAREAAVRALEERTEMEAAWASAAASLVEQACAPWAEEVDRYALQQGSAGREVAEAAAQTDEADGPLVEVPGRVELEGEGTRVAPKRTGGRQTSKARFRRQAAARGTDVMDWMRIREHQRQLAEAVGGGDAWPAILEQRLEAARSRWASLQEASCYGGDAVRCYMRATQVQALRFASEEAG